MQSKGWIGMSGNVLREHEYPTIARRLYNAQKGGFPIELLSREYPGITQEDAYAIQKEGLKLRLAEGDAVVGRKIGITSQGMMDMLNVNTPDYGYLLESTRLPEGGVCATEELNIPIVEGELAFVLEANLDTAPVTEADVVAATEYVVPCFEVCDARFPTWDVTVCDTISDNAGAARFMLGSPQLTLSEIDPSFVELVMEKNGQRLGSASGSEVMGSPVNSVVWLANRLLELGDALMAGDIVLSGAFMAADRAQAGDVYTILMKGFYPLTMTFK